MFCTGIGKRRSFHFTIVLYTVELPLKQTEYIGIVSRPPTRECGSKGQVSSPKKHHAAAENARDLWLDACLLFYLFCAGLIFFDSIFHQYSVRLGRRNVKKWRGGSGFLLRASIDPWPKIRGSRIFAAVRTCWGVPSPDCVKTPVRGLPQTQIFCFLQKNRHKSKRWFCLYAWIAFTRHSTPSI